MDRLLKGYSWGEAAYMSEAVLSWQMCFIGDPLYRPFREDSDGVYGRVNRPDTACGEAAGLSGLLADLTACHARQDGRRTT